MIVVKAELITEDEAKQVRKKAFEALKQHLTDAGEGVTEVIAIEAGRTDEKSLKRLTQIQSQIKTLAKKVEDTKDEDIYRSDIVALEARGKEILAQFERLDTDVKLRVSLILAETKVVLAYSSIRWMADAQVIINDPELAMHRDPDWTFYHDKLRLGKEIERRFPRFYGHAVEGVGKNQGISVLLGGNPPNTPGVSPINALAQEVEKFLAWELRKVGLDMTYDLVKYENIKVIEVEIKQAPK